jgi:hypothetical protein
LVSRLRAAHYEGQADAGLGKDLSAQQRQFLIILHPDMDLGSIGSMRKLGITESYKLKRQVVLSASEAAEMIIRSAFSSFFPSHAHLLMQRRRHPTGIPAKTRGGLRKL